MYERIVTKAGEVIWLRVGNPYGRHEIARWQFATWERSQTRSALKRGVEL